MTDAEAQGPLRRTDRSLPIALLRAREKVMGPLRAMLAASGVSEQKWRVLRVLHERGPMDLTPLAREACLMLPSLHRMIAALETEGLVRRQASATDRRKVTAAVTDRGEALILAHAGESARIFRRIGDVFGHERLEQLLDMLEDLRKLDLRDRG